MKIPSTEALSDTGWLELPASFAATGSKVYYRKIDNIVNVIVPHVTFTGTVNADHTVCNIPVGFRPKAQLFQRSWSKTYDGFFYLTTGGDLKINFSTSGVEYNFNATYMV